MTIFKVGIFIGPCNLVNEQFKYTNQQIIIVFIGPYDLINEQLCINQHSSMYSNTITDFFTGVNYWFSYLISKKYINGLKMFNFIKKRVCFSCYFYEF